jgi:hypothetical protein
MARRFNPGTTRGICSRQNNPPSISPAEPGHRGCVVFAVEELMEAKMGRGILLWLLGVPIPVIILLWLFFGH